jgi:hypothetical protein
MSTLRSAASRWGLGGTAGVSAVTPAEDLGQSQRYARVGAASGVLGVLLLVVGTALHPVPANANDASVAFAVYAEQSRSVWLTAHLLPMVGISGMVLAMVLLSRAVTTTGGGRLAARITQVTGAASIAVTAALQAVDGVALKAMVDRWAHASATDRPAVLAATESVRQVEIGLDAVFSLSLAFTTLAFAAVLWEAQGAGRVLAGVSIATSATASVAGVLFGLQGFSPAAMNAGMASGVLGMVLTVAAAAWARRRTGTPQNAENTINPDQETASSPPAGRAAGRTDR